MPSPQRAQATLLLLFCALAMPVGIQASETRSQRHARALTILRAALKTETGFKKIHAAEALIWTGYPQGVEAAFHDELRNQPESIVGVWRTLAQLPSLRGANRRLYLRKIYTTLPEAGDVALLRTLESLAKLRFTGRSPLIRRYATARVGRPAAMARWVLANSGETRDELRLAGLLAAPNAATRGTAAYALRWLPSIRPRTLERLRACAEIENSPSPWRTFVLSAYYVHAEPDEKSGAKARLLSLLVENTPDGDKYEIGQALALQGDEADLPLLQKLMSDPEIDVRISAAYAAIQIDRRHAASPLIRRETLPHRRAFNPALTGLFL